MNTIAKTLLLLSAAAFLSSCLFIGSSVKGDGTVVTVERELPAFSAVQVTSGMNAHFVQGDQQKVEVVADQNLHELIETSVEDNTLLVKALGNIWSSTEKKVVITCPGLNEIRTTAGSNVFSEDLLHFDSLILRASAGSNIRIELEASELEVQVSSGANIFLSGSANRLVAKTSSGANLKAEDFTTEYSDISVSSGSNVWVNTMRELTANASSGGNIFYFGTPKKINSSSSSGGNINKR